MNDADRDYQQLDVIDDIHAAVAQITDDQIEDRLQETLRRASRIADRFAGSDEAEADAVQPWLLMWT